MKNKDEITKDNSHENDLLNTTVLPKYNCSNCSYFQSRTREVFKNKAGGFYAYECDNLVHPLLDCVLRGFKHHSAQPSSSQTLNK